MSRLGDVRLVHHFEQALNSCLRESIYHLHPMPRTWVEWKREASILDNQWRRFNATCPQMMMSKNRSLTLPLNPSPGHRVQLIDALPQAGVERLLKVVDQPDIS